MRNFNIIFVICLVLWIAVMARNAFSLVDFVGLLVFGLIIMPATILFSFNTESNQLQHFLHTVHSIHKQIIIKIVHGALLTISFYLICSLSIYIFYLFHNDVMSSALGLWDYLWFFCLSGLLYSFYPTAIVLVVWCLHQWFRHYVGWGLSALLLFGILYLAASLFSAFKSLAIYTNLTSWGTFSLRSNGAEEIPFLVGDRTSNGLLFIDFGFILFYAVICVLLYFLSVYILNRKVEV